MLINEAPYVGEIGLDGSSHLRRHAPDQLKVFAHVLKATARAGGRIMSIHSRGAADEVLGLLRCHDAGIPVLHWFTGTPEELRNAVAAGCWFSVGPAMLKSEAGRARAAAMPRHRVLTETDGPFGKAKGKQLEPKDVGTAVAELAKIWSEPVNAAQNRLDQNLRSLSVAGQR
jgi:TatD DNase family protein